MNRSPITRQRSAWIEHMHDTTFHLHEHPARTS